MSGIEQLLMQKNVIVDRLVFGLFKISNPSRLKNFLDKKISEGMQVITSKSITLSDAEYLLFVNFEKVKR